MNAMVNENKKTKKIRFITSFIIITISIILLFYYIINDEPIIILVILILILKTIDIAFNFHIKRSRIYKHQI